MTALLIAKPLSDLYNKSLALGIFPERFKEANVRPIYKNKGSPSDFTNYRPISILSAVSKVFEKVVYRKIYQHITENSLLSEKQSGYRKHHSTEQQLLHLTHNLYQSLDMERDFTAVYLDISKYFDKIWHFGLLNKCKNEFGISGTALEWIESYLKNRKQRVQINETFSETETINAGCPQGSVLGPLLALIYLDGLSKRTQNNILFFADDTTLYASHSTDLTTTQTSLQQDLDEIDKYGREWAITFNAKKTIQQTFSFRHEYNAPILTLGGVKIPIHDSHKHLGLTFSKDMRFHEHINEVCNKINKTLSPLYPIAKHLPRPILDQIYKTYIRPHFDYCDIIYDGLITIQDSTRLDTLQNRAARLTTGTLFRTRTDKLQSELGWEKLTARRRIHRLTFYQKLLDPKHSTPNYIQNILPRTREQDTNRTLRNLTTRTMLPARTTIYQKTFFIKTGKEWNNLPETTRITPYKNFKKEIAEKFGLPNPPQFYNDGSKRGNILHTRLRAQMSHLNSHLFRIQKTDSPACICGHKNENNRHFILHCPNYTNQRNILFDEISQTLQIKFSEVTPDAQLDILLHGSGWGVDRDRLVARHFQNFLFCSRRFDLSD